MKKRIPEAQTKDSRMRSLGYGFLGFLLSFAAVIGVVSAISMAKEAHPHAATSKAVVPFQDDALGRIDAEVEERFASTKASTVGQLIAEYADQSDFAFDAALYEMLSHMTLSQSLRILEEYQSMRIPSRGRKESIERAIVRRLASIQPSTALNRVENFPWHRVGLLATDVFHSWFLLDFDSALKRAQRSSDRIKRAAIEALVVARGDLDDSTQLDVAKKFGMEPHFQAVISEKRVAKLTESPEDAWNELVSDAVLDVTQREFLFEVADSWIEQDGLEVLVEILGMYKGVEGERFYMAQALLAKYSSLDPIAAFKEASSLPKFEGGVLLAQSVRSYALAELELIDPALAVRMLAAEASEINEFESRHLWKGVIHSWAKSEPREILANLDLIPESMHDLVYQTVAVYIVAEDSEEAIRLLKFVPSGPYRFSVAASMVSVWLQQDLEQVLEWVLEDPDISDMRNMLLGGVLTHVALQDPNRAFDLALEHRESKPGTLSVQKALDTLVLGAVARRDPRKALELLSRVSADSKMEAYREVSLVLLAGAKTEEVENLGKRLSPSEQAKFFGELVARWAEVDSNQFFETVRRLPSEVRSQVARQWLAHESSEELTSRKRNQLKRFAES